MPEKLNLLTFHLTLVNLRHRASENIIVIIVFIPLAVALIVLVFPAPAGIGTTQMSEKLNLLTFPDHALSKPPPHRPRKAILSAYSAKSNI